VHCEARDVLVGRPQWLMRWHRYCMQQRPEVKCNIFVWGFFGALVFETEIVLRRISRT
jgi:hypothetical protein